MRKLPAIAAAALVAGSLVAGATPLLLPAGSAAAAKVTTPKITSLKLGRTSLPAKGGASAIRLHVTKGATCWVTGPKGLTLSTKHRACKRGYFATVVRAKAIDTTTAARYKLTAWVASASNTKTSRSIYLAQSGLSAVSVQVPGLSGITQGAAYSATFSATGGTAPFTWSVSSGFLPPGLGLSTGGVLSGTPTSSGSYSATIEATDSSRPNHLAGAASVSITVGAPAISITTSAVPTASVNEPYYETLTASGGSSPYYWSVSSGSLPPGLSLESSGYFYGTPTTSGTYTATVEITDSSTPPETATETLSISVLGAAMTITSTTVSAATVGIPYGQYLYVSGGTAPITWEVISGAMPPGLTLSTGGEITGTPTTAGTYTATVEAFDASVPQKTAEGYLTVTVLGSTSGLTIATSSLPAATVGVGYGAVLSATGGTPPYTWTLIGGALPSGITLSSSGVLGGAPATGTAGTYSPIFKVADSSNPQLSATVSLSLIVSNPI